MGPGRAAPAAIDQNHNLVHCGSRCAFRHLLFLGQYARKETVTGYLTPTAGTAKIFASQQGTIKEIYVKEGQQVEKEQPLLAVETSQIAANGQDVNVSMLATLEAQRNLLTNQIAAEQERTKSEQARLTALIGGLETEISELHAQIEIQNEGIRVSSEMVSSVTGLRARGLISELEYRQRELAALEQKQKLNSLNQQLAARQNQLTETRYSLEQLPTVTAGKIQSLRSELATTEQRIAEISGRRAYVIRAPAAGRISTLQATVGQFADPRVRRWKSSRTIAFCRPSCLFRPELLASCGPDRMSESFTRRSHISSSVHMAAV